MSSSISSEQQLILKAILPEKLKTASKSAISSHCLAVFPPARKSSSWKRRIPEPGSGDAGRYLADDLTRFAQAPQGAALLFVKWANAARGTIPGTSAAAGLRQLAHGMAFVVDGRAVGAGRISRFSTTRASSATTTSFASERPSIPECAPIRTRAETVEQFDQRHFAIEAHHRSRPDGLRISVRFEVT